MATELVSIDHRRELLGHSPVSVCALAYSLQREDDGVA
jgi:hypothetical protein